MTATDLVRAPSQAQEPVNESAPVLPAPALRPFIAYYSGYRQAGVPPAGTAGCPRRS